eukprot:scaffold604_cov59-Phaeocystis_antarctica.AAC.11
MWSNEKTFGSSAPPREPVTCSAASSRLPCRMIVLAPPVGRMRTATVTADRTGSSVAGVAGVVATVAASRPGVERGGRRPGESSRRPGVGESGRRAGARMVGVRTTGVAGAAVTAARAFRGVDRRTPAGDAAAAGRAARAVAGRLAGRAAAGDGGPLLRLEAGRSPGIGLAVRRWERPSIVCESEVRGFVPKLLEKTARERSTKPPGFTRIGCFAMIGRSEEKEKGVERR